MKWKSFAVVSLVVLGVVVLVTQAARTPIGHAPDRLPDALARDLDETVGQVNQFFDAHWAERGVTAVEPADELLVLRRLSLSLQGTIPSLEEIRAFGIDSQPQRLSRWTARLLSDVRFADYFAERLARSLVGVEDGQFVIFRRDRFVDWLSEQLHENRPYDAVVRSVISETGLVTDKPASNFVTAAISNDELDENKLAGRAVRAFLGQRMDCAQCHDHPFDVWTQNDFEGLASFFGQSKLSILGVEDKAEMAYTIDDSLTLEKRVVAPSVPFHPEWLPAKGTRRERLAAWITHPENRRFERALVNRVWGLMFGKPYIQPVDGLPDPSEDGTRDILDILGTDFREHGYDLQRLIHVIAASRPFQLSSSATTQDEGEIEQLEDAWALFPLVRLRPEQIIGSMLQAASIKTIDQNSHLLFRTIRYFRSQNFVKEYGDLGDNELEDHAGTIPQALLRMNGELSQETSKANPFNSSGRIASMASNDEICLETCYLVCLSRRPTSAERQHFLAQLADTQGDRRAAIVEDIFWTLYNSPEFSWNH